jgi:hypothetical protein
MSVTLSMALRSIFRNFTASTGDMNISNEKIELLYEYTSFIIDEGHHQ